VDNLQLLTHVLVVENQTNKVATMSDMFEYKERGLYWFWSGVYWYVNRLKPISKRKPTGCGKTKAQAMQDLKMNERSNHE